MTQWDEHLWLFTQAELDQLPEGTQVWSIMGTPRRVGIDDLDGDTRYGYTAWGVRDPMNHHLSELFTLFLLKTPH